MNYECCSRVFNFGSSLMTRTLILWSMNAAFACSKTRRLVWNGEPAFQERRQIMNYECRSWRVRGLAGSFGMVNLPSKERRQVMKYECLSWVLNFGSSLQASVYIHSQYFRRLNQLAIAALVCSEKACLVRKLSKLFSATTPPRFSYTNKRINK